MTGALLDSHIRRLADQVESLERQVARLTTALVTVIAASAAALILSAIAYYGVLK